MRKKWMLLLSFLLVFPLVACQKPSPPDEYAVALRQYYQQAKDFENGRLLNWLQLVEDEQLETIFRIEIKHANDIKHIKVETPFTSWDVFLKDNLDETFDRATLEGNTINMERNLTALQVENTIQYDWLMDFSEIDFSQYHTQDGVYILKDKYYNRIETEYELLRSFQIILNDHGILVVFNLTQYHEEGSDDLRGTWAFTQIGSTTLTFPVDPSE